MDFSGLARLAGHDDSTSSTYGNYRLADVVAITRPSALLDESSGAVARCARASAAAVVCLVRSVAAGHDPCTIRPGACGSTAEPVADEVQERQHLWQHLDAGLADVRAQLDRDGVPLHVFQAHLLTALRDEDSDSCADTGTGGDTTEGKDSMAMPEGRRCDWVPCRIGALWRLHRCGMLSLSNMLEANELSSEGFALYPRSSTKGGGHCLVSCREDLLEIIVQDMRRLSSASRGAPAAQAGKAGTTSRLASEVAQYLLDIGYRKVSAGEQGHSPEASGHGIRKEATLLASRAAKRALDWLCCGRHVLRSRIGDESIESRLRGCLVVMTAVNSKGNCAPSPPNEEENQGADRRRPTEKIEDGVRGPSHRLVDQPHEPCSRFLARQLRLMMDDVAELDGQTMGDADDGFKDAETPSRGVHDLLVEVVRHFSSEQLVDALTSICRRAIATATRSVGLRSCKPLLQWNTLGLVVRAAVKAHVECLPPAIARIGTEMAAAAISLVPVGGADSGLASGCGHDKAAVLLSASLRLVAQADACAQQLRQSYTRGGLYGQWVQGCFGGAPTVNEVGLCGVKRPAVDEGEGIAEVMIPSPHAEALLGCETVRGAMHQQRTIDVLLQALSLSVPSDPCFVLEVHRDMLKSRQRTKFSMQVRDCLDLVLTRLSDLKSRQEDPNRRAGGQRHENASGRATVGAKSQGTTGDSDPARREVGFFLRQFKQTGQIPLALKTAVLFQPRSWATFRKILLAPPGERTFMSGVDGSGAGGPLAEGDTTQAGGHGDRGLRVEVSLKYRRLLVQQLAKDGLLSKKDYEAFRQSYVDYIQGQREKESTKSASTKESEPVTAVARQLLHLESFLQRPKGQQGMRSGQRNEAERREDEGAPDTSIVERLALLLQDYLPRALAVELSLEDDHATGSVRKEAALARAPDGNWFTRVLELLRNVLREWEMGSTAVDARGTLAARTQREHADKDNARIPPAEEVAEAVLNSIHCCVAAVPASLGLDVRLPIFSRLTVEGRPNRDDGGREATREHTIRPEGRQVRPGKEERDPRSGETVADTGAASAVLAFRRISDVVRVAAGVVALGEELCNRCCAFLADPCRLDVRQVFTVAHIVASLPSVFHVRVEQLWTDAVAGVFGTCSACTSRGLVPSPGCRGCCSERGHLFAVAQAAALYLQSCLFLRFASGTFGDEKPDSASSGRVTGRDTARVGAHDTRTAGADERKVRPRDVRRGAEGVTVRSRNASTSSGQHPARMAPIVMLEFLWWLERRLSIGCLHQPSLEDAEVKLLSHLLASVLSDGGLQREMREALRSDAGVLMPSVKRLITLEIAIRSGGDFLTASAQLEFVKSITLGRLWVGDAAEYKVSATAASEHAPQRRRRNALFSTSALSMSGGLHELETVWRDCVSCLLDNSSIRDAARLEVSRRARTSWACVQHAPGGDEESGGWQVDEHPSWSQTNMCNVQRHCDADSAQALLGCLLDVLRDLCTWAAIAGRLSQQSESKSSVNDLTSDQEAAPQVESAASKLFEGVLAMLDERGGARDSALSSLLVVVAEEVIPAICASEGPRQAFACLHLAWHRWCRRVRPVALGAVVIFARMLFMCCGRRSDFWTRSAAAPGDGCQVIYALEEVPVLAVEMVRSWPRLELELRLVVGPGSRSDGPFGRRGWISHLNALHDEAGRLFEGLSRGDGRASTQEPNMRGQAAPESEQEEQEGPHKGSPPNATAASAGRVPLGPVDNGAQGWNNKEVPLKSNRAQKGIADRPRDAPLDGSSVSEASEVHVLGNGSGMEDGAWTSAGDRVETNRLHAAAASLPRTCAELVISVFRSVATSARGKRRNRSCLSSTLAGGTKRAKPASDVGEIAMDEGMSVLDSADTKDVSGEESWSAALQPPHPASWGSMLLQPLYGRADASALSVLLEAVMSVLGDCSAPGVADSSGNGERATGTQSHMYSFSKSLFLGILLHAPQMVVRLGELFSVVPSSGSPDAGAARFRQLIAVLDCLEEYRSLQVKSLGRDDECFPWLTTVCLCYGAAVRVSSKIEGAPDRRADSLTSIVGHAWAKTVTFVHRSVRDVPPRDLRLIPAALALREVDPLMEQYFS